MDDKFHRWAARFELAADAVDKGVPRHSDSGIREIKVPPIIAAKEGAWP
jgi:hypothetical protein